MFMIQMKEKSAENVVHSYLSAILALKGKTVSILSDNSTEFKIKQAINWELKDCFHTYFIHKEMHELRMSITFYPLDVWMRSSRRMPKPP